MISSCVHVVCLFKPNDSDAKVPGKNQMFIQKLHKVSLNHKFLQSVRFLIKTHLFLERLKVLFCRVGKVAQEKRFYQLKYLLPKITNVLQIFFTLKRSIGK